MIRTLIKYAPTLALAILLPNTTHASWLGISDSDLRNGNVGFESIPGVILAVTEFLLGFVGTIAMIMIMYGAVRIGYGAVADDKEAGKKIVTAGIVGFVISVSGWFIINFVIDNF